MKKTASVVTAFAGMVLMSGTLVHAQDQVARQVTTREPDQGSFDEDIRLFRKDVRSLKKQLIAANIDLTDAEAQAFWPIYDQYTAEMIKVVDKKYELLKEYAQNYETITDEQADSYIQGRTAVEQSILQLRIKYMPIFRKVLPGKKAALFAQMDWRISLVIDLQVASQVPMIQP